MANTRFGLETEEQENCMEMVPVRSSAIRAVGYDPRRMHMRILFEQGHAYDFCRVPAHVYRGLMDASSKGTYYNHYIRDQYPC
ncbi:KTSC domain-containing protein [Paraburkholderia sp. SOS3]|uniref:KTSC domain-containing protein n=1 Tax=Paraburkholderia sp. SOS3 TaxID=1926494 RepID=UPI001E61FB80|nr:KTSC domain-containing protein [Paraburkholderia sp. SOS3]